MNNYSSFKENVSMAKNAEGTLLEQSEIYADGWEAARDRVTAAAEKIHSELLDDKAFISILKGVEGLVSGFGSLIDIMGGLKGVLPIVSTLMLKTFSPDISSSIDNFIYNSKLQFKKGREEIQKLREDSVKSLSSLYNDGTASGSALVDVTQK